MKKLLILLWALALLCLPALAETLPETNGNLIMGFRDEDTCSLLVDQPDGARVFIGGVWEDDEWTLTTSSPLPPETEMYTDDDDYYGLVTLGFYHPSRGETPWVEVGVSFLEDGWQVTDVMVNRGDMVAFEEDCITSYIYDDYYGVFTLPLQVEKADWLALPLDFEEAMALMDTTGFEAQNADRDDIEDAEEWAPDPDTLAFCEAHLPGYTLFDGCVFEDGAVLLADDSQGLRYFFGCVRDGEEWVITRSTPLPEGASCETFHIGPDWLRIWLPLPRERQNVRDGETAIRCTVWLSGGRWEVGVINGIGPGGVMSFRPHALHDDTGEIYYGDYDLPLDVTEVDWSALPASWTEALALLDTASWAQVQRGGAAWYTQANMDSELLGTFTMGAPLRLLAQMGDWAQVSPIGSDMTGWMPLSDLLCGSDRIEWNEEYGYWHSRLYVPETGLYEGDTPLHPVAHEETDVQTISLWEAEVVDLLGLCSDGCCAHVYIPWADRSGYVPFDDLHPEAQMDVLTFRRLPEYTIYTGFINEDFFAYTMIDPQHPVEEGGHTYLFCGVRSKVGWWIDTLSVPLPAGVWPTFRSFDKDTGAFSICLETEELEDLSFTFAPAHNGSWHLTGMTGTSRDTHPGSYTLRNGALYDAQGSRRAEAIYLACDLTAVDWLALPRSFDEAMALALPIPAGYTALEGWQGTDTAMYLLKCPDGATVFAGLEKTAEGWLLTESSPLPPGECMLDTYHVSDGCITIHLPNEGSAAVTLQEDGRWLLTWANDTSVSDHGLYFGVLGMYYADVSFERDITRLDWTALPHDYEDWLPWADSSRWAVVGTEAAPLYAEDGSIPALYRPAAPVRLLEERGDQYRVAVNGGSVTGWMNKADLLAGDMQLTEEEGFLALAQGYPETLWPRNESTALLDSPEGKLLGTSCYTFDWLGTWKGVWLHVRDSYTGTEGFVRAEEVMNHAEWLESLTRPQPQTAAPGESFLLEDGTSVTVHENGVLLSSRWGDICWYGTLTLPQDGTLPETHEELIARLDTTDWAYLTQDAKLPRLLQDGSTVTDWYREGTPVKLLADEPDGSSLASVCGGETQVRVPGELLSPADTQYVQDDIVGIWLNRWQLPALHVPAEADPVTLYSQPGGQVLHTLPQGESRRLLLLANCSEDGWLHVSCKQPIIDGYVHIDELPQDCDDVMALRLLPDDLNLGGSVGENACGFIMRNPQNETVFVGAERLENGTWRFTESKPLPSSRISFDSGHSYDGESIVFSVLDEEATALYGMDQWTEYIVSLEEGQWLLGTIYDLDWMDFSAAPMIYVQDVGSFFGSVTFDRNVATLDWSTLPESVEELLAGLDESWAVLREDMTLLTAPGDTMPLRSYHAGTPVQIRRRTGELVKVAVLGSSVTGWLHADNLAFGPEQLVTVEYTTSQGEPGCYYQALMDQLPWADVPQGTPIYARPDGEVTFITEYGDSFPLLGTTGNWLHLYLGGTDSGFVRMEE